MTRYLILIFFFLALTITAHPRGVERDFCPFTVGSDTTLVTATTGTICTTPSAESAWEEDVDTCTDGASALDATDTAQAVSGADPDNCVVMTSVPVDPTLTTYDIVFSMIDASGVGTTDCAGVYFAFTDSTHYYAFGACDDVGNAYRLYIANGGTPSSLGTGGTFDAGETAVITIKRHKGGIRIFENGVLIINSTDTTLTAAGEVGIWSGNAQVSTDDAQNGISFDNVRVIDMPRRIY